MKVYELAKKLELTSVILMRKIKELKLPVKNHMVVLTPEQIKQIEQAFSKKTVSKKTSSKKSLSKKIFVKKTAKTTVKKTTKIKAKAKSATSSVQKKPRALKAGVVKRKPAKKTVSKKTKLKKETVAKKTASSPALDPVTQPKKPSRIIIRRKEDEKPLQKLDSPLKPAQKKEEEKEKLISSSITSGKSMRLDLVSVKSANPLDDDFWSKEEDKETQADEKKQPKRPIAEKEISSKFNATDFRKREVIFQPRKKKTAPAGEFKSTKLTTPKSHKRVLKVHGEMSLDKLSRQLGLKKQALVRKLKSEGLDELKVLDYETIALIAPDFGWTAKNTKQTEKEILRKMDEAKTEPAKLKAKPPVVTIMGHVDHGKTTLLDTIRKTKTAAGEAGGITQHIGAYSVCLEGRPITFIDTPGHSAFTAMRSRGAEVTDIVVILVAADDGVQPQTIEALNHAKAAKTPFLIAVSKIDAPGANIDKVKQQMSEHEVQPEEWGGDVSFIPISSLKNEGIKELLQQIQLLAEMQELKYNPESPAKGVVLESRKEKGLGCIVSLLVQDGSLSTGSTIVAGEQIGRVRQMKNDHAQIIKSVSAGFPLEMIGLNELPQAGDSFCVVKNEKSAKDLLNLRKSAGQEALESEKPLSPEELLEKLKAHSEEQKETLHLVLKADARGSLEALKKSLEEIKSEEVNLKIIHSGVGGIAESDVLLASTVSGSIFGFNVRPDGKATSAAKEKDVPIYSYSVIYQLLDQVKNLLLGLLKADFIEEEQGQAEVRDIFHISKVGTIAGCYITKGKVLRASLARLIRDGRLIYNGPLSSLRRHKDDVKQVGEGFECGLSLENFNDIKPKDIIECYIKKEQPRTQL